MTRRGPNRAANIWTARIIPVILLGIIGYSSWITTKKVCIGYLLNQDPSTLVRSRPGTTIAILVIYYLLLLPLLVCYGRLLQTVFTNPGFVPRSPAWYARNASTNKNQKDPPRRHKHRRSRSHEKEATSLRSSAESLPGPSQNALPGPSSSDNNLPSQFWHKDVFVANFDGRPPYCSTCLNWKPDRTHHCSEVARCVQKMDHFCPWVGGIVSETSFKFFIQFLFYTALFTTHTLIFSAYFLAERQRRGYRLDVHWLLLVVFAAMFWLFSAGMCTSSMQFAMLNVTTIENFDRRGKVWYLCVFLPRPEETLSHLERSGRMVPRTIPYPRPAEETAMLMQDALNVENANRPAGTALPVPDLPPTQATRVFAILELPAGANPWDCGPLANVKEVLGYSLLEWLLPVKRSPCARHVDPESTFKLGPAVGRVMREAGLVEDDGSVGGDVAGKKKKRRRRRSTAEGADREGESGTDRRRRDRRKRRDRGRSEPGARSRPRSREGA